MSLHKIRRIFLSMNPEKYPPKPCIYEFSKSFKGSFGPIPFGHTLYASVYYDRSVGFMGTGERQLNKKTRKWRTSFVLDKMREIGEFIEAGRLHYEDGEFLLSHLNLELGRRVEKN